MSLLLARSKLKLTWQILGLQTDLGLEGNQYASCLAIFFAFYIASEVPSNLIIKKVSPRIWLGILTMVWGVIGMAMGFATSFSGLLAVRAFLGMAEGGFFSPNRPLPLDDVPDEARSVFGSVSSIRLLPSLARKCCPPYKHCWSLTMPVLADCSRLVSTRSATEGGQAGWR